LQYIVEVQEKTNFAIKVEEEEEEEEEEERRER